MSEHAGTKKSRRTGRRRTGRIRALLSLGVALGIGAVGTFAFWTDDVAITGSTFTAGTLDLQVNNSDTPSTTTLGMTGMVPGVSTAEVLTVKNNNTAPLKYTMTGGLTGTNASDYNTAASNGLLLTISVGGSRVAGTGINFVCSGGTVIVNAVPLTSTTTTAIITPRRPAAAMVQNATDVLCFQVKLADTAPSSLQGKTATALFTATGTTDVS
jgi:predicted ribosomally synthesized peptide with SipW-like signal peptide